MSKFVLIKDGSSGDVSNKEQFDVIVSRALPDVRDGLKPVHRRILYSMMESGFSFNKPHRKSAFERQRMSPHFVYESFNENSQLFFKID